VRCCASAESERDYPKTGNGDREGEAVSNEFMMRPHRGQICPSPAMMSVVGDERTSLLRMSRSVDDPHVHNSLLNAILHDKPALRTEDSSAIS
jgi:hypothetical protein